MTESVLLAVACSREHTRIIDLLLEALREMDAALEGNVRAGLAG